MNLVRTLLVLLLVTPLTGCALLNNLFSPEVDVMIPLRIPEPVYEELFPHYVELCAVSQYRPIGGKMGGVPGHGVMYLKGVCRDESAGYPKLKMCDQTTSDLRDPLHGVGISVNKMFKSVNWVATPGRQLFFNGDLDRGEVLTRERYDQTIQKVIDLGLLTGVEVHDQYLKQRPPDRSPDEFIADDMVGTDMALRFARTLWCSTEPLERAQVEAVIEYLNELNGRYALGKRDYLWSGYHDNCVHLLRNSLAAASVWSPKWVRVRKLAQLLNLSVPANEFINLATRANLFEVEDFSKVWSDGDMVEALLEYDWLPTRHGALIKTAPIHQPNELYDSKLRIFVLEGWGHGATDRASRLINDARFIQLEENLRYYQARYQRILERREEADDDWWPRTDAHGRAKVRYFRYIEKQLAEVERMIEVVNVTQYPGDLRDREAGGTPASREDEKRLLPLGPTKK